MVLLDTPDFTITATAIEELPQLKQSKITFEFWKAKISRHVILGQYFWKNKQIISKKQINSNAEISNNFESRFITHFNFAES
jgi:hypothetical protein